MAGAGDVATLQRCVEQCRRLGMTDEANVGLRFLSELASKQQAQAQQAEAQQRQARQQQQAAAAAAAGSTTTGDDDSDDPLAMLRKFKEQEKQQAQVRSQPPMLFDDSPSVHGILSCGYRVQASPPSPSSPHRDETPMQRLQRENAEAQQMEMQTTAADPLALLRAFKEKEAAQAPQQDAEPDEDESDEQEEEVEEEEEPEPEPDSKATSVVAAAPAPAPKALRLEPTSADLLRTLGQRTRRTLLLAAEAEFERCHEPQPVSARPTCVLTVCMLGFRCRMLGRQQHTLFADPTLQQQPLSEEPLTFPPMSAANRKCLHSLAERFGATRTDTRTVAKNSWPVADGSLGPGRAAQRIAQRGRRAGGGAVHAGVAAPVGGAARACAVRPAASPPRRCRALRHAVRQRCAVTTLSNGRS